MGRRRELAGLRVLVTGASQGIGRAIALEAAKRDMRVLASARNVDLLNQLAEEAKKIGKTIAKEENRVRVGMGGALMSIGKRNKKLNAAAIKVAKAIGPIHFSDGDKKCEPMNVLKHLTSDSLRSKLGI